MLAHAYLPSYSESRVKEDHRELKLGELPYRLNETLVYLDKISL
jgi:hypothetical protein